MQKTRFLWNDLGRRNEINWSWIKAHVGHEGNEKADELAKLGIAKETKPAKPNKAWVKGNLQKEMEKKWNKRWRDSPDYQNTKLWFKNVNTNASKRLLNLPRVELGLLTQFITSFCNMNHHSNKKDSRISPMCRICNKKREKPWHLVTDCDPLHITSRLHLGAFQADRSDWSVEGLRGFVLSRRVRTVMTRRIVAETGTSSS